jgi:predicted dehydrogenase
MKALVVGLGSMGKRRVRNLKALGVESVIGFDLREDRRNEAKEKYGIDTFSTYEQALEEKPQVVLISLPPDLHVRFALQAAQKGLDYFIEASLIDRGMDDLIKITAEKKLVGFPSCTMRYYPGPKKIRSLLKDGAIGKVLFWQYQSGQYLPDWHPWESIKDFYVGKRETGGCREIVPFELTWLTDAFGAVSEVDCRKEKLSDLPVDIDDIYMMQMKHEGGILGQLIVDVLGRSAIRDIRITGSEGTIEWNMYQKEIRTYKTSSKSWEIFSFEAGTLEKNYLNPEEPYIEEVRTFLNCVSERKEPAYSLLEDRKNLHLLYSAEASSDQKRRKNV